MNFHENVEVKAREAVFGNKKIIIMLNDCGGWTNSRNYKQGCE
jgi:hypothetical protein